MKNDNFKLEDLPDQLVSAEFLASCFEVSERTVFRYAESKDLPRTSEGKFSLMKSLLWYISKLKNDIEELSEDNPLVKAKLETQNLINRERQIKIQKEVGKLVPSKLAEVYLGTLTNSVNSGINNLENDLKMIFGNDSQKWKRIHSEIIRSKQTIIQGLDVGLKKYLKDFDLGSDVFDS
jgi:hypothetical protein